VVDDYFKDVDLFIDIGVGFADSEAWAVNCDIIGFEPNPIRFKDIDPVYPGKLYNKMVTSKDGYVYGFECSGFTTLYTDNNVHDGDTYKKRVYDSVSVDSIVGDYKSVFVWADTEGSELDILKGAANSLKNKVISVINLEVREDDNITTKYGWPSYTKIVEFLKQYDYVPIEEFNLNGADHMDLIFTTKERFYALRNM